MLTKLNQKSNTEAANCPPVFVRIAALKNLEISRQKSKSETYKF